MMKISPSTVTKKIAYPTIAAVAATVAVTSCTQKQQNFVIDFVLDGSQQQVAGVAPMLDTVPVYEVSSTGEHIYKGQAPLNEVEKQMIPGRQQVLPQGISGAQVVPSSDTSANRQAQ